MGILASKIIKYISKNFIYNCVDMQVDAVKEIPFYPLIDNRITELLSQIVSKQKDKLRYDYMINEQKEIDQIVYGIYGLNKDDIQEVEKWYSRHYPKLEKYCNIET